MAKPTRDMRAISQRNISKKYLASWGFAARFMSEALTGHGILLVAFLPVKAGFSQWRFEIRFSETAAQTSLN
jgi:hypothetical protein